MTLHLQSASNRVREVRLHDGRLLAVNLYGYTSIHSDTGDYYTDFSWRIPAVIWHDSAAEILIGMLSTHSVSYVNNCALYFGEVAKKINQRSQVPTILSLQDLEDFPQHQPISGWAFVQAVLGRWVTSGRPGLDPQVAVFLKQPEKWEEKGNGQYFALVANDPERGALTDQELRSVYNELNKAYAAGWLSTKDWALASFLIGTGVRPIQIARMRKADIVETAGPEGRELTLFISIAKTREAKKTTRWRRKCQTQLAEVMLRYLGTPEMRDAAPEAPLFFESSQRVSQRLAIIFNELDAYSDRLTGRIPLFPYRFRYTMGTRAIAMGARDEEVARLLTHTSLHCVRYYRAAMPELQAPIEHAIGNEMALFARAFRGRLIDSLADATRANDETAIIAAYEFLNGPELGACGTRAQCHQDAPRGCLTCDKFEPFREAPWEDLRTVLVEDRDKEREERIRLITQEQIDAVDGIIFVRDALTPEIAE